MKDDMNPLAVVTGASSGLGAAIKTSLEAQGWLVLDWSLEQGVDVSDPEQVARAACLDLPDNRPLQALVNCAGINIQSRIGDENNALDVWDDVMNANARSFLVTAQATLASLVKGQGAICNITSNAAHVPMTFSSVYNASKGAAQILTRQMHRELWKAHGVPVFGVSPNKLAGTGMSRDIERQVQELRGWSPEEAQRYQLASLAVNAETPPECVAEFLAYLLSRKDRHLYLGGCIMEYGA